MSKLPTAALAALALCLSACTMDQNGAHFTGMNSGDKPSWFCAQPENTNKCILAGFLTAGLITGIVVHNHHGDNHAAPPPPP